MSSTTRAFRLALAGTLLVKLLLAAAIPLTGDEAYFFLWGRYPALGFYDHPPMVGWLLTAQLHLFGHSVLSLRLPAVLLSTLLGWLVYRVLRERVGEERAALGGILFLLAPVSWVDVFTTTDTPLILFTVLSGLMLQRAFASERWRDFILAGALLGLAMLSKYFAALAGFTYLLYVLATRRRARAFGQLAVVFAAALPFVAVNVYWNYYHCWDNVLFNVFNRNSGPSPAPGSTLEYLLMLVYLLTPPLLWQLARHRRRLAAAFTSGDVSAWLFWGPMVVFLLLTVVAKIGLHWVLSFYPFFFISAALILEPRELRTSARFMGAFAGLNLLLLLLAGAMVAAPLSTWNRWPQLHEKFAKLHEPLVFGKENRRFAEAMLPYAGRYTLATNSYAESAMLQFTSRHRFIVFGPGSMHARQDDMLTDFRRLDGHNILIFLGDMRSVHHFARYFRSDRVEVVGVDGTRNYLLFGKGFNYPLYRRDVLAPIRERYYRIPWYLPHATCYFCARYFPNESCERR